MLIDIFARRYENVLLRNAFEQRDSRLLLQAFRILSEDFFPYYVNGKEDPTAVAIWTELHRRLSRELGVAELSQQWFSNTTKWNGNDVRQTHKYALAKVCENWLMAPVSGSPDQHVKDRLSLIELGFREREAEIVKMNAQPISTSRDRPVAFIGMQANSPSRPQNFGEQITQMRAVRTASFRASVDELNARFRQAVYALHYHNGFIQASTDTLVQTTIEEPFWALVSHLPWTNVDTDMKEALDLRDSDGRDPAFYAARALESTIKIISDSKGWSNGREKGAHNYIDHLQAKKNAYITPWEATILKDFFTHVRNPFGHGPGSSEMPSLTRPQTEWAIEFSMTWIKNLIRRS